MGQQGDGAWGAPENSGQPQGGTPEQAPPTVIGPARPVPGPDAGQPAAQPFQASPWPAYQQPPPGYPQSGGQPQWGQQPDGQPPQWGLQPDGQPPQWGQQPGGQPQWGPPSQSGGYGGPFASYGGPSQRPGLGMLFRNRRSRRRRPFLRTLLIVFIILIAAGIIAAVNRVSGTGDNGDAPSNAPVATYTAKVGSGITLAGLDAGEQMNVTVSHIFSSAAPADPGMGQPAGMRVYAVQFTLKDTGSAAYTKVRFILDSGDGPQTGLWKIG